MNCLRTKWWCIAGALACLVMAGCGGGSGEKLVTVTGTVMEGGSPIKIDDFIDMTDTVLLRFIPIDETGKQASQTEYFDCFMAEDGTFETGGPMGDGIPAHKYRIAVKRVTGDYDDSGELEDQWNDKFGDDNSPFVFDLKGGEELTIDISNPPAPSVPDADADDQG